MLQDHIDVRATEQPELSIRLCHRAPWVCYKANQLQRSRDAAILRITNLGGVTEQTSYRGADIMVIDKNINSINGNNSNSNMNRATENSFRSHFGSRDVGEILASSS